jgi:short-subunit dehydrogenase
MAHAPGTALVTGPTAGIGHSFAHQLAGRGHDLVLVARNEARLIEVADQLRREHGVQVEVLSADLTDRQQLATVEARLTDPDRPVELLVNNAALGQMAERRHGGVINVSSVAAFLPRGSYAAAKAWVNSFTEWAANEYRSRGVTVMALCPGFTKTEFHERMHVQRGTGPLWLDPDKLVATALSDFDKGRVYSIPSPQYKAIVTVSKLIPNRALQGYQSIGRR